MDSGSEIEKGTEDYAVCFLGYKAGDLVSSQVSSKWNSFNIGLTRTCANNDKAIEKTYDSIQAHLEKRFLKWLKSEGVQVTEEDNVVDLMDKYSEIKNG